MGLARSVRHQNTEVWCFVHSIAATSPKEREESGEERIATPATWNGRAGSNDDASEDDEYENRPLEDGGARDAPHEDADPGVSFVEAKVRVILAAANAPHPREDYSGTFAAAAAAADQIFLRGPLGPPRAVAPVDAPPLLQLVDTDHGGHSPATKQYIETL